MKTAFKKGSNYPTWLRQKQTKRPEIPRTPQETPLRPRVPSDCASREKGLQAASTPQAPAPRPCGIRLRSESAESKAQARESKAN